MRRTLGIASVIMAGAGVCSAQPSFTPLLHEWQLGVNVVGGDADVGGCQCSEQSEIGSETAVFAPFVSAGGESGTVSQAAGYACNRRIAAAWTMETGRIVGDSIRHDLAASGSAAGDGPICGTLVQVSNLDRFRFSLAEPTRFALRGRLASLQEPAGVVGLAFSTVEFVPSLGGAIQLDPGSEPGTRFSSVPLSGHVVLQGGFSRTGTLSAGTYQLGATVSISLTPGGQNGSSQSGEAAAFVSVSFGCAACPVDMNCDGSVDLRDLFEFLRAWFAGGVAADFDSSGGEPEIADLFVFLRAWFRGC